MKYVTFTIIYFYYIYTVLENVIVCSVMNILHQLLGPGRLRNVAKNSALV